MSLMQTQYLPHVQAVTAGTSLTLMNNDRVLHNVHANLGPIQVFNVAMPIKGQKLPMKLRGPGSSSCSATPGTPG